MKEESEEQLKITGMDFLKENSSLNNSLKLTQSIISPSMTNIIGASQKSSAIYEAYNKISPLLTQVKSINLNSAFLKSHEQSIFNTKIQSIVGLGSIAIKPGNVVNNSNLYSIGGNANSIYKLSGLSDESSITKAMKFTSYAEKSILSITPQNLGSKINIEPNVKHQLKLTFNDFNNTYSKFNKSLQLNPLEYTKLNPTLTQIAPIEYFSTANLFEAISVEEEVTIEEEVLKNEIQYESEISLSEFLPKIDPDLYNMWKGAVESIHTNNSDKVRHFITSIRELFTHVLHNLAPNSEIAKWSKNPSDYDKGNPTRKARLKYICRNIDHGSFTIFLEKDIETTLAFIQVFQSGTHKIKSDFTDLQLFAIKSKAESTLKNLFEINLKANL